MSSDFVRYAPEIETIDPHLDESLAQIIDFVEKKGRESPTTKGAGRAVRAAHAKSFGLVKAEVEMLPDVPAAYAQGIDAQPGRHGALIRFSSTSGHLGTDAQLGSGLGFLHPHPSKGPPNLLTAPPQLLPVAGATNHSRSRLICAPVARATCVTLTSEETSTLGGHYDC
jgi:hypothetical protein